MGRGSSKAGGGGGAAQQQAQVQQPQAVEGKNVEVRVRMDDGSYQTVNVSIQDMSQYDNLQGKDYIVSIDGSRTRANSGPLVRQLAGEAERNAYAQNGDDYIKEPDAKAGKWSKTSDVPALVYDANKNYILTKADGYATKVGNDNLYIQKRGGEWVVNFKGMAAGRSQKTLAAAKTEAQNIMDNFLNAPNGSRIRSMANSQFKVLNRNGGKVANKVWKEIDFDYVAGKI